MFYVSWICFQKKLIIESCSFYNQLFCLHKKIEKPTSDQLRKKQCRCISISGCSHVHRCVLSLLSNIGFGKKKDHE